MNAPETPPQIHPQAHSPFQACIGECWSCRTTCMKVFFDHCLPKGGKHLEKDHVAVLMDCIQVCQAAADSMVRQSPAHAEICAACAAVCTACAEDCDDVDTPEMRQLAAACRACAALCHKMATGEAGTMAAEFEQAERGLNTTTLAS